MEIFKLSKSLGFEEKLTGIKICDLSLLAKWLREKHGVDISILILGISDYQVYVHKKRELKYNGIVNFVFDNKDNIYEEALEIGLQEALKLI